MELVILVGFAIVLLLWSSVKGRVRELERRLERFNELAPDEAIKGLQRLRGLDQRVSRLEAMAPAATSVEPARPLPIPVATQPAPAGPPEPRRTPAIPPSHITPPASPARPSVASTVQPQAVPSLARRRRHPLRPSRRRLRARNRPRHYSRPCVSRRL